MKNVTMYKVLTPLLALSLLVGCNDSKNEIPEDVTYRGFKLDTGDAQLSGLQQEILTKVNNEEPIPFMNINVAMMDEHGKIYVTRNSQRQDVALSIDDRNDQINSAIPSLKSILNMDDSKIINIDDDFHNIKVQSEAALKEKHAGANLIYNKSATSPLDLIDLNKMQCYSGTVFQTMVYRSGLRKQYVNKNPVVIYTAGHILPGYIAGGELFGVETTAAGRAKVRYGLVSKLNSPMRIIDAEIFALSEIFKNQLKNPQDFLLNALKQTAEKYQIPLDRLEALVAQDHSAGTVSAKSLMTNSDMMSFGQSNVAAGDIVRSEIEEEEIRQPMLPEDMPIIIDVPQSQVFYEDILMRDEHFIKNEQGLERVLFLSSGPTYELLDMVQNPKLYNPNNERDQNRAEALLKEFRVQELYCRVNDPLEVGFAENIQAAGSSPEIRDAFVWQMERSIAFDCGPYQFSVRVQRVNSRTYDQYNELWLAGFNMILNSSNNINYIENIVITKQQAEYDSPVVLQAPKVSTN